MLLFIMNSHATLCHGDTLFSVCLSYKVFVAFVDSRNTWYVNNYSWLVVSKQNFSDIKFDLREPRIMPANALAYGVPTAYMYFDRRLLVELDGFKGATTKGDKSKTSAPGTASVPDADHVNYQLFYRPEQAKFTNMARV